MTTALTSTSYLDSDRFTDLTLVCGEREFRSQVPQGHRVFAIEIFRSGVLQWL